MSDYKELYDFLKSLPEIKIINEMTISTEILPEFVSILGYAPSQLFYDIGFGDNASYRADAMVSSDRENTPWLIFEIKNIRSRQDNIDVDLQYLPLFRIKRPGFNILFSTTFLMYTSDKKKESFYLDELTEENAKFIYEDLKNPKKLPNVPMPFIKSGTKKTTKKILFKINEKSFSKYVNQISKAKTNKDKKDSFEGLAKFLFESIPFLEFKYSNLRTSSSEIDLVFQYKGFKNPTIFDEFGRFILVECKNWQSSVGAKEVRDFIGKLEKTRINLGVLFAQSGISGEKCGNNALREINYTYDNKGIHIIVISGDDLKILKNSKDFYSLLEDKFNKLRFDILGK